jgi:DedD protein
MANRSEPSDPAVDELRRRARRRLVGAIVLALAAAVLLPLLLESEPKPLGDDVSIQIPPLDSGKFVNPLSQEKPAPPPAKRDDATPKGAAPAAAPAPAPVETAPSSEAKSAAPAPAESRTAPETKAATPQPTPAESRTAPETKAATPQPTPAESRTAPETKAAMPQPAPPAATVANANPQPAPAASSADAKSEAAAKDGAQAGFVVQVAAFTDRYGALALVRKLKAAGFPSYTEPATTSRGTMHRVRVGPYAARADADAARVKLKASGYDAMVARAQ